MTHPSCYIGVDIGTATVRAGVFTATGKMLGSSNSPLQIWRQGADFIEQSSEDIWTEACRAIRTAVAKAGIDSAAVRGIGFDATCSLVALDRKDAPVGLNPTGSDNQNVIVWMDHRSIDQARRINATQHPVLKYVGGMMSPEMQTPKLLWIKEHLPHSWKRAARFFDLADFMVYRATGYDVRSLCTTVCKWTYLGHEPPLQPGTIGRWEPGYFELIGLKDLVDEGFQRIGRKIRPIGEPAGEGLTAEAAKEMGLETGTAVSIAIIDAHAGGIGLLGATVEGRKISELELERRLAIIAGTSSCHMAVSGQPHFVPGVWGPYKSAMIPGMWLTEGGQTSTGSLVNHVIFSHAHSHDLKEEAKYYGQTIYERLNFRVEQMAKNEAFRAALTQNIHVLPYFHGNRSPLADATLRGMISGLNLSYSEEDLARLYLATIQAIAYGDRHIIAEMNAHGYEIDTVFICAGLTKNKLFLKESADITQCKMILPLEPEAVLLGSSILGAVASKDFSSILEAMQSMCHAGTIVLPEGGDVAAYHDAKYAVFHEMYRNQVQYNAMMRPPF